jgi:hypothetical protein
VDIFGGPNQAPTDVILECAPELVGDVLSIHLSQQADSGAVWTIRVRVQIAQGWFRLGQFVTNTVATDGAPARVVGFASCPGARGWALEVSCPTDAEIADLVIQSSKCCSAVLGVTKNVVTPPEDS